MVVQDECPVVQPYANGIGAHAILSLETQAGFLQFESNESSRRILERGEEKMADDPQHRQNDDHAVSDSESLSDRELYEMVDQLCESKAEEFRLIGYDQVTAQDIWDCASDTYRKTGLPPLYRLVNDILSLKANQFMNYLTLRMYRGDNFD